MNDYPQALLQFGHRLQDVYLLVIELQIMIAQLKGSRVSARPRLKNWGNCARVIFPQCLGLATAKQASGRRASSFACGNGTSPANVCFREPEIGHHRDR